MEKIGEFCEFFEIEVTEISTGSLVGIDFAIGVPKGWPNFEITESLRFFQSSTELVEPETSRINRLLSAEWISTAWADEVKAAEFKLNTKNIEMNKGALPCLRMV